MAGSQEPVKEWVLEDPKAARPLMLREATLPSVGDHEVLIRIHAVALNYRDIMVIRGHYHWRVKDDVVPCADAAGQVVQVGSKVSRFHPGDRVNTVLFQNFFSGFRVHDGSMPDIGAGTDGTLRTHGVFAEHNLVSAPTNLSYVQASTLSIAGLTAWDSLFPEVGRRLLPGDTVLVQGSGGVSIFALQFARMAGAQVIATTSSSAKAERLRALGAKHVINYNEDPNWGETAKKLTPRNRGVDFVVEVGGPSTLTQSVLATGIGSVIAVVGFLAGRSGWDLTPQFLGTLRRIQVGSRHLFEQMNRAVEVNGLEPVVDRVFPFEQAQEALDYLEEQKHVGKVVIQV